MGPTRALLFACLTALGQAVSNATPSLHVSSHSGYISGLPMAVRVELRDGSGRPDRRVWDTNVTLESAVSEVSLNVTSILLRHGIGSAMVTFSGSRDFTLVAKLGGLEARRSLRLLDAQGVNFAGGVLSDLQTTWSGIVRVTNDVFLPAGYRLTLASGTLVLMEGVTNGTIANDVLVQGALECLGTEAEPVTITCAQPQPAFRWGQIRHSYAQPAVYRHTFINRAGRGMVDGHTATTPVIRPLATRLSFESCTITDLAEISPAAPDFGEPGKILQSSGASELAFTNCLFARARMGPEVAESTLFMTNCHIQEMRGPDDADGLFLDVPTAGSRARISHCTIVEGDDDGIDTLDAVFTLQDTIIRGWRNAHEDSKGISLEGGEAQLSRVLLTDVAIGVSGKGNTGARVRLGMDRCTVFSSYYALGATNDSGTQPIIDYTVTNSILRGTRDSIFTQYEPSGIRVYFSNLGETWAGSANTVGDPGLSPEMLEPLPGSPCIDGGYSLSTPDPDGSLADIGFWPYRPPAPLLRAMSVSGANMQSTLTAFPGRNYILESTFNLREWAPVSTNWQAAAEANLTVAAPASSPALFIRARLAGE